MPVASVPLQAKNGPQKINPYFAVGPKSQKIICPMCHESVETDLRSRNLCFGLFKCCIALLLCCIPIICCYQCLPASCDVKHHYCPKCEAYLGYHRRP